MPAWDFTGSERDFTGSEMIWFQGSTDSCSMLHDLLLLHECHRACCALHVPHATCSTCTTLLQWPLLVHFQLDAWRWNGQNFWFNMSYHSETLQTAVHAGGDNQNCDLLKMLVCIRGQQKAMIAVAAQARFVKSDVHFCTQNWCAPMHPLVQSIPRVYPPKLLCPFSKQGGNLREEVALAKRLPMEGPCEAGTRVEAAKRYRDAVSCWGRELHMQ